MSGVELGAIFPRMHADAISRSDAHRLLTELNTSEDFRSACVNLGFFASDLSVSDRHGRALACFELLLATTDPPKGLPDLSPEKLWVVQPDFVKQFKKRPFAGTWEAHLLTEGRTTQNMRVSSVLADRVVALEAFWGVRPYILIPRA